MAQVTSSNLNWSNRDTSQVHEDIKDMVTDVSRTEAPVSNVLGGTTASNVNHEWWTWALPEAGVRAYREGADFMASSADATARVRIGNYLQDHRETIAVSGRAESLNTGGRGTESAMRVKRGLQIQARNGEAALVGMTPGTTAEPAFVKDATEGTTDVLTDGTKMGGFFSFANNWVIGDTTGLRYRASGATVAASTTGSGTIVAGEGFSIASGATNGVANGNGYYQITAGNNQQLDRAHLESVLESCYINGNGNPTHLFVPGALKRRVSEVLSIDTTTGSGQSIRRLNSMDREINVAMDGVSFDFGFELMIVPNYIMDANGASNAFLMLNAEEAMLAYAPGRKMDIIKLDPNGDNKRIVVTCDKTLEVSNPATVCAGVGFTS